MKLPRLSIENYQFTLILFFLLTIAGVNSYFNMPRTENPEMTVPGGSVIAIYPGANPVDLEQLVITPLEDAINELEDIKKIESTLSDGLAIISVEFTFGTDPHKKYSDLVDQVNTVKNQLPEDLYSLETMEWKSSDIAMLQFALVSDTVEYSILEKKAEELEKNIKKIRSIRKTEIHACPKQEIRISLDLEKMAQMNISIDQVENAIRSNNINIPGGLINLGNRSFSVMTSGSYENIEEIENTVVQSYMGRLIYLKNIVTKIDYDYEDLRYYARYNGRRAIFLTVTQKEGLNIFKIHDKLIPVIEEFKQELDKDIELYTVYNQTEGVDRTINGFLGNLRQGIILVGLIILLALGLKSSIIVIFAIPLSIIMGLVFVDVVGYGLEQISIAGLVVALGLLVDNSIVMIENINRYLTMGYKPKDAAIEAASEIGWPIVSATITTVLAFIPIITMPDKAGEFIRSMPAIIIATLSFSLLIALTLNPLIASKILKANNLPDEIQKPARFGISLNEGFLRKIMLAFIEGPYRKTLNIVMKNKMITITIVMLLLIMSFYAFIKFGGISMFPKAEKPQFMIRINLPDMSHIDRTDEVARYVESILETIEQVEYYATNVGHGNPRIYYNEMTKNYTKKFAEIFVQLKEYETERFDQLIYELRVIFRQYEGAEINVVEFEQGVPVTAPIMVYIHGEEVNELQHIASEVEKDIKQEMENGATNIENQLARSRTDLHFNINKDKAMMLGIPIHIIDKTIRTAISGASISKYRNIKGEEYNIVMRMPVDESIKIKDFDKIYVQSLTGKLIPLMQVASLEFKKAPSIITHYNLDRTALITADVAKGSSIDDIMNPVIEKLDSYPFPKGYSYHIGGELENRAETFGGMGLALMIAVIAIFSVLVLQFRSFLQPLIIFIAFPLGIIGVIWALLITGNTFSFTAFIGFISLSGIVINNSIILVDYTNILVKNGTPVIDAIKQAGETRFTPILLTTLTTIGGLLPLTLRGGSMWAPMGWTIIGGLLVSTFLTLLIVPILYHLFSVQQAR